MRKLTAGLFMSVDGVVEAPNLWQGDAFDDEMGAGMMEFMARTDTAVMGRVGYQEWAAFWPGADDPFAAFINPIEKFVASRTLSGKLEWQNSTLIDTDLGDFIGQLKRREGKDIALMGGISLVRQLLFAGLLDELMLMIHPVVAGKGRRLFEPGDPETRLTLNGSMTTSRGNVISRYSLRKD